MLLPLPAPHKCSKDQTMKLSQTETPLISAQLHGVIEALPLFSALRPLPARALEAPFLPLCGIEALSFPHSNFFTHSLANLIEITSRIMADDEQIGTMMAENLNLKDLVSEQNETISELRQQLSELNERLSTMQTPNMGTEHVWNTVFGVELSDRPPHPSFDPNPLNPFPARIYSMMLTIDKPFMREMLF